MECVVVVCFEMGLVGDVVIDSNALCLLPRSLIHTSFPYHPLPRLMPYIESWDDLIPAGYSDSFMWDYDYGDGMVFLHAGGTMVGRELGVGEELHVDTGCLVAFVSTVQFDVQFVGGVRSALLAGEGLFFARLRGPGRVWLQSLPFSRLAGRIGMASRRG